MANTIYLAFATLGLAGCATGTLSFALPEAHPASSVAALAAYPSLRPFLMTETNLVVGATGSIRAEESGPGPQHGAKPEAETPHKHEHN